MMARKTGARGMGEGEGRRGGEKEKEGEMEREMGSVITNES